MVLLLLNLNHVLQVLKPAWSDSFLGLGGCQVALRVLALNISLS